MKKLVLHFFVFLFFLSSCKVKTYNQLKFDEKSGSDILYGYTKADAFENAPFDEWYNFEKEEYQVDNETVEKIKSIGLGKIKIEIVMGSWCSDSQREVPRLIKILESVGYEIDNLEIINVDHKKEAEKTKVTQYKIERIPTIILSRNKKEIGRIVESPKESLEKDILKIIGS